MDKNQKIEALKDVIGPVLHAALRKQGLSDASLRAYQAIADIPGAEWSAMLTPPAEAVLEWFENNSPEKIEQDVAVAEARLGLITSEHLIGPTYENVRARDLRTNETVLILGQRMQISAKTTRANETVLEVFSSMHGTLRVTYPANATVKVEERRKPQSPSFPSGTVVEVTYHAPRSAREPQTYVKHAGHWWKNGVQLVYTDNDIDGFIRRGTGVLIHKPEGN